MLQYPPRLLSVLILLLLPRAAVVDLVRANAPAEDVDHALGALRGLSAVDLADFEFFDPQDLVISMAGRCLLK